ncbi:MAG: YraN family protein [Gammaproteobacteria bacterium]|nr:MAG: YraN family protein [Gammaproteobacteria bacterium]PIE37530.1 MAG: YraN family protein [Gammaproteobacteria bacterium]
MSKTRGDRAEQAAANYLKRQGLSIIERNYRCKGGELDIIARDQQTLVFVEVRLRNNIDFGSALASIGPHKRARLIHTAGFYLQNNPKWRNSPCRFDVIALQTRQLGLAKCQWLKNAFSL